MPRPLFIPGKDLVPIVQEAVWAPGPVWTGAENLAHHRDSIPGPSSPQPVAIPTMLPGPLGSLRLHQNRSSPVYDTVQSTTESGDRHIRAHTHRAREWRVLNQH